MTIHAERIIALLNDHSLSPGPKARIIEQEVKMLDVGYEYAFAAADDLRGQVHHWKSKAQEPGISQPPTL